MLELETERLRLRHWQPQDFDRYADFHADEEQARFIGGACSRPVAWRRMAAELGHWILRGYGMWALQERKSSCLVGCVGLWFPEGWPELELGYWIFGDMQGKGYATEAGLRSRAYAYEVLGAATLISNIHADNTASIRVAERLGARYEKTIELLDYGPHRVYRHPTPDADRQRKNT